MVAPAVTAELRNSMLLTTARANTVPCARQSSGITRLSKGGFLIAPRKFRKLCSISECLRTWFHISNCHQYSKSQLLSVGIFFARSPSENRNDVASVASAAARFPARFPQIPLSVISRDASARDATSSIFNDLQAAGSISNLVGRLGIGKRIGTVCQNSRWLPPRIP